MKRLFGSMLRTMFRYFFHSFLFIISLPKIIHVSSLYHVYQASSSNSVKIIGAKGLYSYITKQTIQSHTYCHKLIENVFDLEPIPIFPDHNSDYPNDSNTNNNDLISLNSLDTASKSIANEINNENMQLTDFKYRSNTLTIDMIQSVSKQLGYIPLNIVDIGVFKESNKYAMQVFHPELTSISSSSSLLLSSQTIVNEGDIESSINDNTFFNTITQQIPNQTPTQPTLHPLVAVVYPLNCNSFNRQHKHSKILKPFPTVIWLTCPELHTKISKLEDAGWISKLQTKLNENKEYQLQMENVSFISYVII